MTQPATPTPANDFHAVTSKKAALRLLPLLCLVYFMAFVDRTNVGLAKTQLEADVGIGAAAFGAGAGIFFLSYAFLEVPSNLIMHRVGPRRWIARIAVTWGTLTACMMFVRDEYSFYAVRFLLGAAEAGLYPALMYVVTLWFAQAQRARIVGIIYLAVCVGLALGAPMGGAIMELDGALSLFGWQWMFMVEGLVTVAVGFAVLKLLPDGPHDARWLTREEADVLVEHAAVKGAPAHATLKGNVRVAFGRPFILVLAFIYFANQVNSVAIQYNFPSIVESLNVEGSFLIGVVSGSIGVGAFIGVLLIPRLKARLGDEIRVISVATAATTLMAIGYAASDSAPAKILFISLAMLFLVGVLPMYWSVAMARMSGLMAAAGLAFINTIGLLGGFVGPYLYGWAEGQGSETAGFAVLIGASLLGLALIPFLRSTVQTEDLRNGVPEGVEPASASRD